MLERSPLGARRGHRGHGPRLAAALAGAGLVVVACGEDNGTGPGTQEPPEDPPPSYEWDLPAGFPAPPVPEDNPMTPEEVALGRHLFYDQRLSGNETMSCASCHDQALAFTDGKPLAVGSTNDTLPRSAMSLTNVGYQPSLTWADISLRSLTEQALIPMFAEAPVELGLTGLEEVVLDRLRADETYQDLFPEAFPEDADPFTIDNVTRAIASFERTLISGNSPEDRFRRGETSALSASAQRGRSLFFSDSIGCVKCHSGGEDEFTGVFFTSNFDYATRTEPGHVQFDNTGLYNLTVNGEEGWYPEDNTGLYAISGNKKDIGRFKVPTLRNIALTAPYMHDGSIATLDEVLDHYSAGGRTDNPNKSHLIEPFELSPQEREDLIHFLEALTDEQFVTDPRFSNPWPENSPARGG